ncbi:MAG: Hsp20/alpha crystallin family protein [Haloferacaceae archaeon]
MTQQQFAGGNERFVRRYDYGDGWAVAADLGVADEAVDVDVVGQTAIVVVDAGGRVSETEFDLPGDAERVGVKNGVLSIHG